MLTYNRVSLSRNARIVMLIEIFYPTIINKRHNRTRIERNNYARKNVVHTDCSASETFSIFEQTF